MLDKDASNTTPDVSIFDIDLFDTPKETIQQLHALGKKVICYFSAGSYENWRPDASEFKPEDLGHNLDGWPGEKWLKLSSDNVRRIMKERMKMAVEKGCDGVDPDNVDAYVSFFFTFYGSNVMGSVGIFVFTAISERRKRANGVSGIAKR